MGKGAFYQIKRELAALQKERKRMWAFIEGSGLEERYTDFCETGEVEDIVSMYIDRCLFISMAGYLEEYQQYNRTRGVIPNYKANYTKRINELQTTIGELEKVFVEQARRNIRLQDRLISYHEARLLSNEE